MWVILSGCSGGGKTTLVEALARRGFATVPEPGLRIVREELGGDGAALPWIDGEAFARRAVAMAREDMTTAPVNRPVFFDRGLIDAAVALEHASGCPQPEAFAGQERFCRTVFHVPPWPEHFRQSTDRQHDFEEAVAEYERLFAAYARLGFTTEILSHAPIEARVETILTQLDLC